MKIHLVSGGCGFVGRNIVKRLYQTTKDTILFIDNLSTGAPPNAWLDVEQVGENKDIAIFGAAERLLFLKADFRNFLAAMMANPKYLQEKYGLVDQQFSDVFHFAALGDNCPINKDPIKIGLNLAVDADFFYWVTQHQPERILYASASDISTTTTPATEVATGFRESLIDSIGNSNNIYAWSKLTGEYLARITAQHYGLSVTCIRLFMTYGGDQGLASPIPAMAARIARKEDPLLVIETSQQRSDFIHIEDVLDGIFKAMAVVKDGTAINLGSGQLTSFIEIIHTLCTIGDYEPTIKQTLDKPPNRNRTYAKLAHTKEKLDWTPKISLEDGLIEIYQTALERERAAEVV